MPKSETMVKLFWSLYADLSYLDKLKVMEKMIRGFRLEEESAANETKVHEAT